MNRYFLYLSCLSLSVFIGGCAALFKNENAPFKNHGKDYLEAAPLAELKIPETLDQPQFTPLFPVAELSATDEFGDTLVLREYEVPRPDSPYNSEVSFGVKIQKLGENQWLSVGVPTNQAWPSVQNYLAVNSIPIIKSSAPSGLIETDWLKFNNDDGNAVRFRVLIDKGLYPETTEIHITQNQVAYSDKGLPQDSAWPSKSDDFERESWLLRQIAEHLASSIDNSSASLLGQDVGGPVKAQFQREGGEPSMRMRLDQERAWVTVAQATRGNGFVQWETNKKLGVIYAGFDPELTKEKGFWGKAFSLGGSKLPEKAEFSLERVLAHLSGDSATRRLFEKMDGAGFDSALKNQDEGYLIVVSRDDTSTSVVIRDHRGRLLPSDKAKALLRALRTNLI